MTVSCVIWTVFIFEDSRQHRRWPWSLWTSSWRRYPNGIHFWL